MICWSLVWAIYDTIRLFRMSGKEAIVVVCAWLQQAVCETPCFAAVQTGPDIKKFAKGLRLYCDKSVARALSCRKYYLVPGM